jgi:hypothetical protein
MVSLAAALVESRAARFTALTERAAALERERDAASARAAVEERLRIARDLHDLVGHGLTGIAVQSSTARLALEAGDAARAELSLRAVEESTRSALAEVRQVLGVLRSEAETAPAHSLDDLPALVAGARSAGRRWPRRRRRLRCPAPSASRRTASCRRRSRTRSGTPRRAGARAVRGRAGVLLVRVDDDGHGGRRRAAAATG